MSTLRGQDAPGLGGPGYCVDDYLTDINDSIIQTPTSGASSSSSSPSATLQNLKDSAVATTSSNSSSNACSGKTEAAIAIVAETLGSRTSSNSYVYNSSSDRSNSADQVASFFRLPNGEIANSKNTMRSHGHRLQTPVHNGIDTANENAGVVDAGAAVVVVDAHRAPPPLAHDTHDDVQVIATAAATTSPDNEGKLCQKKHLLAAAILLVVVALVATSTVCMTLYLGMSSSEDLVRAESITNYINSIKLSEETLLVPTSENIDSFTNEQKALAWIIYTDPLQLLPHTSPLQLQQRYALITLLLRIATMETFFDTDQHECMWTSFVSCNVVESSGVTEISLAWISLGTGTLSPDLGLLTRLTRVDLRNSGVTGTLQETFAQWTNLEYIDVSNKNVFVQLTNLGYSYEGGVGFTGTLPESIVMAWTNLKHLDIMMNSLTGTFPTSIGTAWTKLESVDVSYNAMTGSLPASVGASWTKLEFFDVSYNDMTGTIPSSLDKWKKIRFASFENNSFVGSMPNRFCGDQMSTFEHLIADCEVSCPCCSGCYDDVSGNFTARPV